MASVMKALAKVGIKQAEAMSGNNKVQTNYFYRFMAEYGISEPKAYQLFQQVYSDARRVRR